MKKRADGRYCKNICVGYHPDGKRKFRTIYGKTIKEVEHLEREIKLSIETGTYIEENNITVGEWAKEWLETYKKCLKPNTYNVYKYCISAHFDEIGNIRLKDLKLTHLQKIVNSLLQTDNKRAAEIFKSTISQMLDKAVDNELLLKNVSSKIQLPKKQKKQKRSLENKEIDEILSLEISPQVKCFIKIMLYCGLRRGEAWALSKDDIDFKNNTVSVSKTVYFDTTEGRKTMIGTPKSNSSNRIIPIPNVLIADLKEHIKKIKGEHLFEVNGELMKDYQFKKMWDDFKKVYVRDISEVKSDITPHIFRHPYVKLKLKILSAYFSRIFGAKVLNFPLDFKSVIGIYANLFDKHIGKCLC